MSNPNDHPPLYKLVVSTWAGAFKHELVLDGLSGLQPGQAPLNVTDGPALEVRPGGDCRQATFQGVGGHLGIAYEDVVEVLWSEDGGRTWRERWAGYADTVANTRNPDPDDYVLNGFRQRLEHIEARRRIAQDFPNRQWAQLINDAIDSGQLGQALRRAPVPEVGVGTVRAAILPRYESVTQIADKWLTADQEEGGGSGIGDYGVDARRTPIWGKPSGVHVFDEADGVIIEGKAGSSARLCTHVRATWNKPGPGPYVVFGQNLLEEQEGVQATALVQVADPVKYGYASRREPLKPLATYFTRAPCTGVTGRYTQGNADADGQLITNTIILSAVWSAAQLSGDASALNDGDVNTVVTVQAPVNPPPGQPFQGGTFEVEATYPPGPVPWGVAAHVMGGIITSFLLDQVLHVRCPPDQGGLLLFPDEVRQWISDHWDPNGPSRVAVRIARTGNGPVHLTTLGALFLHEPSVRKAVQRHAWLPVPDPETYRVPGWDVEPLAWVIGIYRDPDGREAGRTEPRRADLYRYVLDADGQQWTEVRVAQADEADEVAFAALIERRAQQAAVQASLNTN